MSRGPEPSGETNRPHDGGLVPRPFVFSIPAFWFYDPVLDHAQYIVGSDRDTRVAFGALLEICLAICGIATAVVIFPIAKCVNECVALGYVASRTVESILILYDVGQRPSSASSKKPTTRRSYSAGAVSIALMCGASGTVHSEASGPAIRA